MRERILESKAECSSEKPGLCKESGYRFVVFCSKEMDTVCVLISPCVYTVRIYTGFPYNIQEVGGLAGGKTGRSHDEGDIT